MEPFKLYIANGVTGVRDMGSSVGQAIAGKKRIADKRLVAPRIVAAGPLFEAGEIPFQRALIAQYAPTPEAGRLGVNTNKDAGMDLVKTHNGLSRETFLAMLAEARRIGIPAAGHVPDDVTAVEASNAGLRSIEHMPSITATCRSGPAPGRGAPPPTSPIPIDEATCDEALKVIAKNGTFLAPTLHSSFPWTTATAPEVMARRQMYLKPARAATCQPVPSEERPGARITHEFNERLAVRAAKAGVRLLLATDTSTCRQPGWSTLEEIVLLGRAGVPPIDVLRAATINAATAVDMQAQVGTITRGKLADVVLLDADPLVDVANVNRISVVVADGRLFDEAGRKQLLADVMANAKATGATTTSAQR
jgi:imidazolonepropionase-like amidohydrolase